MNTLAHSSVSISSIEHEVFWTDWDDLAAQIHTDNVRKGFWPVDINTRNIGEALCLVHSELTEALSAIEDDERDDKLPQYAAFDVEIVDAMIRLLDLAGAFKIGISEYELAVFGPGRYTGIDADIAEVRIALDSCLEAHRKSSVMLSGLYQGMLEWHHQIVWTFGILVGICDKYVIDAEDVLRDKITFNRKRPFMHGKAY